MFFLPLKSIFDIVRCGPFPYHDSRLPLNIRDYRDFVLYIAALYERFGVPEEDLEDYYELAAIATVGDVMDLQGENRILVKEGLCRLKNTKNKGLQELIREHLDPSKFSGRC